MLDIPHNETAQKWLAKLEEIAPTGTGTEPQAAAEAPVRPLSGAGGWENNPAAAPPPVIDALPPAATRSDVLNLVIDLHFARYTLAAICGVLGLLMILSFFLAAWMDLSQISFFGMDLSAMSEELGVDKSQFEITALELFMGRNDGENFTVTVDEEPGGFADVRLIDRLLILLPVGGLVLIWLAWSYATGEIGRLTAAGALVVTALLLLIVPFAWESASNDQIEQSFKDSMQITEGDPADLEGFDLDFGAFFGVMNIYEDTYSTGEQKAMGAFALLAALAAFGLEAYDEMSRNQALQPKQKHPAI